MKKKITPKMLAVCVATIALSGLAMTSFAADKLVVKDSFDVKKFVVGDTGTLMLNTDTWEADSWIKFYGAADDIVGFALDSYAWKASAGGGGLFRFARGTKAAKQTVQNGDRIGFFVFNGYDGSSFQGSAGFTGKVDGPVSQGVVPMKLVFETGASIPTRKERLTISSSGNVGIGIAPIHLLHLAGGAYSDGATWINASSRELKENIKKVSTAEAVATLEKLEPVQYNYKADKEEQHVGFIAEDVPDLVATNGRKGLSSMDITAVLTKVVQEQQKTIADLQGRLADMEISMQFKKDKDLTVSQLVQK